MSKKFTEEQYQKIIAIYSEQDFSADGIKLVINYYVGNIDTMGGTNIEMAFAIANPLTREWAHEQFVEKEKKYYWTSKGEDSKGLKRRLYIKADRVRDYFEDEFLYNENEVLTEQQVYQWGYNPEMFDKEEVK